MGGSGGGGVGAGVPAGEEGAGEVADGGDDFGEVVATFPEAVVGGLVAEDLERWVNGEAGVSDFLKGKGARVQASVRQLWTNRGSRW